MSVPNKLPPQPDTYTFADLKSTNFDVICIGSGWAARVLSTRVVQAGLTALLIEEELFGGDCPFWACVPSKALLRPGEAIAEASHVPGVKEQLSSSNVEVEAVLSHRTAFTRRWDDMELLVPAICETNVAILRGKARLVGVRSVEVTSRDDCTIELSAAHAVAICTGSVPKIPNVPGLKEAIPWTPREATSTDIIPEHLLIMGAGAVGTEMATIFNSFGGEVTLLSSSTEILPAVSSEAAKIVKESLQERGVRVITSASITQVVRLRNGKIEAKLSNGESLSASEVLVATGRQPRTDDVGLELFGLPVDGSPIAVDDNLCVSSVQGRWLYAVGNVNGRSPLTHMCKYRGRIAGNSIIKQANLDFPQYIESCNQDTALANHMAIAQVIFTRPAVATVGLAAPDSSHGGRKIRTVETSAFTVGALLRNEVYGKQPGWAQWVIDDQSGCLVGMTVVGDGVGDLIHAATIATIGEVPLYELVHAVPCFPTMSEVYLSLLDASERLSL